MTRITIDGTCMRVVISITQGNIIREKEKIMSFYHQFPVVRTMTVAEFSRAFDGIDTLNMAEFCKLTGIHMDSFVTNCLKGGDPIPVWVRTWLMLYNMSGEGKSTYAALNMLADASVDMENLRKELDNRKRHINPDMGRFQR